MLPKFVKQVFYKILRSGRFGRLVADSIAWVFYWSVKILHLSPRQDNAGLVIISHRYKFIFLSIPKVATRSFFNLLVKQHKDDMKIEWNEKRNGFIEAIDKYPDYYKFSFVRNPYSRILSCYNSKIADNIIGKRARILSFYKNIKGGESFLEFSEWLNTDQGKDEIADRHWLSQHQFLCDDQGEALCDFVGRYETLEEDWQKLSNHLGLPHLALPQKGFVSATGEMKNPELTNNAGETVQRNKYKQSYTPEIWVLIKARYHKDIELFGYQEDQLS